MNEPVLIPQLSMSAGSVRVVAWLAKEGDSVTEGMPIAELETDKASMTVSAPTSGRLMRILVPDGQEADIGAQIATIETATAPAADRESDRSTPNADSTTERSFTSSEDQSGKAYPAARRRARELGVVLNEVSATGPKGLITVDDVDSAAAARNSERSDSGSTAARLASESWTIPQFWAERTVDLTAAARYLQTKHGGEMRMGNLVDFILAATGRALTAHPVFLAHPQRPKSIRLAYIVAAERGLVAPALSEVDSRSATEIGLQRRHLVEQAVAGRLDAIHLQAGHFTISNLGASGVDRFVALVVPGQRAILALGRILSHGDAERQRVLVSAIVSADHRSLGGVDVARFLQSLQDELQHPELLDKRAGS